MHSPAAVVASLHRHSKEADGTAEEPQLSTGASHSHSKEAAGTGIAAAAQHGPLTEAQAPR